MKQPQLFDAKQTEPKKCLAVGCPSVKSLCVYDADVAHGIRHGWDRRPKTCLNRHDPVTAEIPF